MSSFPNRLRSLLGTICAGEKRVWIAAAAVGLPAMALVLVWCLIPRPYYTGTDSANVVTLSSPIKARTRACIHGLEVPAGTQRVQLSLSSGQRRPPVITATVRTAGTLTRTRITDPLAVGVPRRVDLPVPVRGRSEPATVCLRSSRGTFAVAASESTSGFGELTIGGAPTYYRAAVWYLPRSGARVSYLGELGRMSRRAALFAPGFARPWVFDAIFLGVLPLIGLLAVRLLALAVAGGLGTRRTIAWLLLIAALNGMSWAVVTPAFQAPDEVDHFAYVESLVERGQKPAIFPNAPQARWSTAESDALLVTGFYNDRLRTDTRAAGVQADVQVLHRLQAHGAPRNDGGGYETTASYGPLYYYAVAPGYLLGGSEFSRLGGIRLMSALIGAFACVFAFLTVRELAPRQTWLAVLAGLVLVFEPMYSFLSGAINNDVGVDVGAAALAYLLVRLVRRGLPDPLVLVLGALLGVLPWVKSTAYELWPIALVAVALALVSRVGTLRRPPLRRHLRPILVWVGGAVLMYVFYALGRHLNTSLTPPPPPSGGLAAATVSTTGAAGTALHQILAQPTAFATYIWEIFLPDLSFMHRHFPPGIPAQTIFVRRGWAAFGWYDVLFPAWVYSVLELAMGIAVLLGLWALWQRRATFRRWWAVVVLVVIFPIAVFLGFESAFFTETLRPVIGEMGRYEFPALVPLAALGVGGLLALPPRMRVAAGSGLLVLFLALCYAGQALTFTSFFS